MRRGLAFPFLFESAGDYIPQFLTAARSAIDGKKGVWKHYQDEPLTFAETYDKPKSYTTPSARVSNAIRVRAHQSRLEHQNRPRNSESARPEGHALRAAAVASDLEDPVVPTARGHHDAGNHWYPDPQVIECKADAGCVDGFNTRNPGFQLSQRGGLQLHGVGYVSCRCTNLQSQRELGNVDVAIEIS